MVGSIATIVTLGFGTWGSVNLIPTLGYGLGAPIDTSGGLVCATVTFVPRVNATPTIVPSVNATVELKRC